MFCEKIGLLCSRSGSQWWFKTLNFVSVLYFCTTDIFDLQYQSTQLGVFCCTRQQTMFSQHRIFCKVKHWTASKRCAKKCQRHLSGKIKQWHKEILSSFSRNRSVTYLIWMSSLFSFLFPETTCKDLEIVFMFTS